MKEIKLTQGKVALVDDEDYEWLNGFKWYAQKGRDTFYAGRAIRVKGKLTTQQMHTLIMGDNPLKLDIDHIKGNGLDNQRHMLRFCTRQQNLMNRKPNKNCSSVYKGVYWNKGEGKWRAHIRINRKSVHLGYFHVELNAAKAYDMAAIKYFGEFARLNIIKSNL